MTKSKTNTLAPVDGERLGVLFDEAADPMAIHEIGVNGKLSRFIDVNKAFCKVLGYTRKEALKLSPEKLDAPEKRTQLPSVVEKLKNEKHAIFETIHLTKDGRRIPVEISSVVFMSAGEPLIISTARDITKRLETEKELAASKEKLEQQIVLFETLLKNTPLGVFMVEAPTGKPLLANNTAAEMLGRGILPDATKHNLSEVYEARRIGEKEAYPVKEMPVILGMEGKKSHIDDMVVRRPDGTERNIEIFGSPIRNKNGKVWASLVNFIDITEKKKEQTEIMSLKEQFEMALDVSKIGFWELDLIKDTSIRNLEHDQIFGYKKMLPRWGTKIFFKHIVPEDREMVKKAFAVAMGNKKLFFVCRIKWPDKSIHWITATGKALMNGGKTPIKMFGTVRDITEQKILETALIDRDAKFAKLVSQVPGTIMQILRKPDGSLSAPYATHEIKTMFGCTAEELKNDINPIIKAIHPDDLKEVMEGMNESSKTMRIWKAEYRVRVSGKPIRWVSGQSMPEKLEDGSIIWHGFVMDITERKKIEEELLDSRNNLEKLVFSRTQELQKQERFLSSILENVPNMIFVKEAKDLKFELFNKAGEKLLGQKSEHLFGKSDYDFFPKAQADFFIEKDRSVLKSKKLLDIPEEPIKTGHGERILHTKKIPILGTDGKPQYLLGISEDITEQKERLDLIARTKELSEIKAKDEAILGSIGDAVFATDVEGKILLFNKVAETTSGVTASAALGQSYKKIFTFVKESDNKPTNDFIAEAIIERRIKKMSNHVLLLRKDGSTLPIADSASPIIDQNGETIGCVVVYRDATHERIVDKAKTEFVSLASHQLRTPLTSINWLTEMFLKGDLGDITNKQRENINVISKSGKRMAALVSSLLNVSKLELNVFAINPELESISKVVKDVTEDLDYEIDKKGIKVNIIKKGRLPKIKLDHTLIRIICQNLISNAVHYSPPKSSIDIKLSSDKKYYYLAVKDHGIGIPKSDQDKIFTKLFRASNAQAFRTDGNGLGLYITKLILDATSSSISFSSVEGKGSTFIIQIPLTGMVEKEGTKALEII